MIKIFMQLTTLTYTPHSQSNIKIIQSNTIEIFTQLKKCIE